MTDRNELQARSDLLQQKTDALVARVLAPDWKRCKIQRVPCDATGSFKAPEGAKLVGLKHEHNCILLKWHRLDFPATGEAEVYPDLTDEDMVQK